MIVGSYCPTVLEINPLKLIYISLLTMLVACSSSPTAIPPDQDCTNAVPAVTTRITLTKGKPDIQGLRSFNFNFTNQPMQVWTGSEDYIVSHSQKIKFRERVRILQVCSFLGLIQGDVVEADVNVSTNKGGRFYLRSMHKENLDNFDAWDCREYNILADSVRIGILGRATNINEINGNCFAFIHYGVNMLVGEE